MKLKGLVATLTEFRVEATATDRERSDEDVKTLAKPGKLIQVARAYKRLERERSSFPFSHAGPLAWESQPRLLPANIVLAISRQWCPAFGP
jgi:hypothetical protein